MTRARPVCDFPGCEKPHQARGYCTGHYSQTRRGLAPRPLQRRAPNGTGMITRKGYRMMFDPSHPNAGRNGSVAEHVIVMARTIGRPLRRGENVHHINGDRLDNRPENLELWSTSQPSGQRVADKVAWAKALLATYEPEALASERGSHG